MSVIDNKKITTVIKQVKGSLKESIDIKKTNQMEKNDISISIMHWKKSFYIKLESQKRYGYSGVYNWILGENMIPINSEYAEKYTKAMRKRDSADNKVRLIDKFLCSGMAIKYVFMQE